MAPGLDQTMIDSVVDFSNVDEELPLTVPAAVAVPGSAGAYPESDLREGMTAGFDNRNFSCQNQAGNQIAAVLRNLAGFRSCSSRMAFDNRNEHRFRLINRSTDRARISSAHARIVRRA